MGAGRSAEYTDSSGPWEVHGGPALPWPGPCPLSSPGQQPVLGSVTSPQSIFAGENTPPILLIRFTAMRPGGTERGGKNNAGKSSSIQTPLFRNLDLFIFVMENQN